MNAAQNFVIWPLSRFHQEYVVQEPLGHGQFGEVLLAKRRTDSVQVAAKILKHCSKAREKLRIRDEIDILQSLNHPNIIGLLGAYEDSNDFILVLEYLSGGELFQRVIDCGESLSESRIARQFLRQICNACAVLGANNIAHLDIKPENIMCASKDSDCIVKVEHSIKYSKNTQSKFVALAGRLWICSKIGIGRCKSDARNS